MYKYIYYTFEIKTLIFSFT